MKIKVLRLRRIKQVYYFDSRHGVLKDKAASRWHMVSGLMTAVFILGGVGVGIHQLLLLQDKQATQASLQRESTPVDTTKKPDEANDKLKSANTKAREDDQLAKQIRTKLKNVPGGQKWSVYVRDVKSDRMASINADNSFESASLNNLFMTLPLEAKLPSASWNYRAGKSTVAKCVEATINNNDTACAQSISQYAEMKNADAVINGLGYKKTTVADKQPKTSAREVGELLFRLQNSQGLSDKARRTVFDGLYGQKSREGIPTGCVKNSQNLQAGQPAQKCLVANIAGESKSVRHDAAIVTTDKAQYVVVIMTNGGNWGQIADVASSVRLALEP